MFTTTTQDSFMGITAEPLVKGITVSADDHQSFFRRRIHLFLHNGYSVSIVYGTGIYSDTLAGDSHGNTPPEITGNQPEARSVEVAVIHPNGKFVPFADGQDVRGRTSLDTAFKILLWAAGLPSANA
jgi:hypothetical protein